MMCSLDAQNLGNGAKNNELHTGYFITPKLKCWYLYIKEESKVMI